MPLKTLVKVGNISNLSDARYCAGMGVDLLGFQVIDGRENFINPKTYQEMRGWISGPAIVIELYGINSAIDFNALIENYKPDFLELELEDLSHLPETTIPVILSVREKDLVKRIDNIIAMQKKIAYLILDESAHSLEFIKKTAAEFPVLAKLEVRTNIPALLDNLHIKGIALNGSQEIKPGLKNYDHLSEVLEQLEIID